MNIIIFLLKYWKTSGVILLTGAFLVTLHLAHERGRKLDAAQDALTTERQNFQSQIQQLEKARQNEKERSNFRKKQNAKLRFAGTDDLRDAYERLRARQASHTAG